MQIKLSDHFTTGKLIKFTIPTIIMMIFTSIYGIVDGIFVSNCVGSDSFAAVNLIMPVLMIMGSTGFMIGTGGSALVSMTLGEGKKEEANRYFSMLHYVLIGVTAVLAVVSFLFMPQLAAMVGAEGEILKESVIYGRTLILALVPFVLQNSFQSFLVAAERPKMGLMISICAGVTNMVLDFVFVYLLQMGVFGAALATDISQVIGGIIPLVYFMSGKNENLWLVKTKIEWSPIWKSCVNGMSEMLTNLSMSLVSVLYNLQLLKYAGADGVVAYGVIMYVSFIFIGTYLGYSIGVAPVVGYHYGAGNHSELRNLLKRSLKLLTTTAVVLTVLAEILAKPLAAIFVAYDAELLVMTTRAVQLYSLSYIICWFNIFGSGFFTALNNGLISGLISFLRTFLFQVAMIYLLPVFWKLDGIWLAIVVAEALALVVTMICFVGNRKKYHYYESLIYRKH